MSALCNCTVGFFGRGFAAFSAWGRAFVGGCAPDWRVWQAEAHTIALCLLGAVQAVCFFLVFFSVGVQVVL